MDTILQMARRSTSAAAILSHDEHDTNIVVVPVAADPITSQGTDDIPDDDFTPPSIGDNGFDELRKKFFAHARQAGAVEGKGAVSIANFAVEMTKAASEGLLAVDPPKPKKGEKPVKSDAALCYDRYLAGKKAAMEKANKLAAFSEPTAGSREKMVSNLKKFIEVGAALPDGAVDMFNRATKIIHEINAEHEQACIEAREAKEKAPAGGVKGGTFNNLYALGVEVLRKDEDGSQRYENDEGTALRPMTDEEIRGFYTPEGKPERSELELWKAVLQRVEDIGSKFQSPEADAAAHAITSRMKELQGAELAEMGIELVFKPGEKPLTDKQMKVQRDAFAVRNRA